MFLALCFSVNASHFNFVFISRNFYFRKGWRSDNLGYLLDDRCRLFGFSRDEVEQMLDYYGQKDKLAEACDWYDGYRFGQKEIFNPWSIINYVDEKCVPKAFWVSTGSNDIIGEIIAAATPEITENLRRLMQGETLSTCVDSGVIYPEIKKNPSSIYSFLLVAGYLRDSEDGSYI